MNKRKAQQVQRAVQTYVQTRTHNSGFRLELADHTKEETGRGTWSLNPTRHSDTVYEWTALVPSDLVRGAMLEARNNQVLGVFDR